MNKKTLARIKAELDPIDTEQRYRDMLDECEPEVKVGGLTFAVSRVIEELDPVAFRCGVLDYIDSLVTDREISDEIDGEHYDYREVGKILEEADKIRK